MGSAADVMKSYHEAEASKPDFSKVAPKDIRITITVTDAQGRLLNFECSQNDFFMAELALRIKNGREPHLALLDIADWGSKNSETNPFHSFVER